MNDSSEPGTQSFEAVVGFRPDTRQILKVGYGLERVCNPGGSLSRIFQVQFVTELHPLSLPAN